jgi:hypothetical protein
MPVPGSLLSMVDTLYSNKYASTWISAIYGRQNALQESLCECAWMNQLFLQDREESGTGSYRQLCTAT